MDANSLTMGRIMFVVNCPESVELKDAIQVGSHYTTVKMNETDKGYLWIYEV